MKTISNNNVILVDPDEEAEVVAHLMLKMNAFVSNEQPRSKLREIL